MTRLMRQTKILLTLGGGMALLALLGAGCSSQPAVPPSITVKGTVTVTGVDPIIGISDPCENAQAVIVAPNGTVLTSVPLNPSGAQAAAGSVTDIYSFTAKVPGGDARYGVQACGSQRGTIWETPAQMKDPALELDLSS